MIKLLFFVLLLLQSFAAFAKTEITPGPIFEPFIGYNMNTNIKLKLPGETDTVKGNGLGMGSKVGYQFATFQSGFEYLRSSIKVNDNSVKRDIEVNEYAFFLGQAYASGLRFYGAYILNANAHSQIGLSNGKNSNLRMNKGSGFKVGFSYLINKYMYLNAELRFVEFHRMETAGQDLSAKSQVSSLLLSISSPIQFWY